MKYLALLLIEQRSLILLEHYAYFQKKLREMLNTGLVLSIYFNCGSFRFYNHFVFKVECDIFEFYN